MSNKIKCEILAAMVLVTLRLSSTRQLTVDREKFVLYIFIYGYVWIKKTPFLKKKNANI